MARNMYLFASPEAANLFDLLLTETGRRAHLGDSSKLTVQQALVLGVHADVASHVQALSRLARDQTRTEAQRHLAAKEIGTRLYERLTASASVLARASKDMHGEALELADAAFSSALPTSVLEVSIQQFARELTAQPGGHTKLKALVGSELTMAAVAWRAPGYLLGLDSPAEHKALKADALAEHVAGAASKMVEADYLSRLAVNHEAVASKARASFNPIVTTAAEGSRVEIPAAVSAA